MGFFEEVSDCVGHHFSFLGFRCRTGAVKDCNDDDEGNCIGKGKLRVLDAFGDSSESVGSHDGKCGFRCLFRVRFELDFHLRMSNKGWKLTISTYEEEQY